MKPECKKYYRYDGNIKEERWFLNDKRHRTDGPAVIYYWENGSVSYEHWCFNGKHHRADGPAVIDYNIDGSIKRKEWWLNDKLHRTDGPAFIGYKEDGNINYEYWYLNGKEIDPEKHLIPTPETEEKKIELINEIAFIEEDDDFIFIKDWLKRDKEFYEKYRVLIE